MSSTREYLRDILDAILKIEEYTQTGKEAFFNTGMMQDAVIRNFEIIGEAVKRIPKEILDQQPSVPWRAVAGFRDVLIHEYNRVDLDEVWLTVEQDIPTLHEAVEALLADLPDDE